MNLNVLQLRRCKSYQLETDLLLTQLRGKIPHQLGKKGIVREANTAGDVSMIAAPPPANPV